MAQARLVLHRGANRVKLLLALCLRCRSAAFAWIFAASLRLTRTLEVRLFAPMVEAMPSAIWLSTVIPIAVLVLQNAYTG